MALVKGSTIYGSALNSALKALSCFRKIAFIVYKKGCLSIEYTWSSGKG